MILLYFLRIYLLILEYFIKRLYIKKKKDAQGNKFFFQEKKQYVNIMILFKGSDDF